MKLNKYIISVFFFFWMFLNLAISFCVIPFLDYPVSIPYLLVMFAINLGIAYDVSLLLNVSFVSGGDPKKLDSLSTAPKVAVLYVTCNDAMPEALSQLNNQSYKNYSIFVLDDSTDVEYKKIVNRYDYQTLNRGHRKGAKAGAVNHWLSLYGSEFDYFVLLDHGGILESSFIEEMLKYAEHPENANVAIFQSLTRAWNTAQLFPKLLDAMKPLERLLQLRVFNQSDSMLSWGHNILCRIQPFLEIGGFEERFATEDFATNLRLIECGYESKAVDVISYDHTSETIWFHTKRMIRWSRGNLETAISKSWNLPFATQLRMFMGVHCFSEWFFYVLGMLLVIWGYRITWHQLQLTLFLASRWNRPDIFIYPLTVLALYIMYGILLRPLWVIRLTGISFKEYWGHSLLSISIGYYAVFYLTIGQFKSLVGGKAQFIIYKKRWFKIPFWEVVKGMRGTIFVIGLITIGLIINPVGRVIHFFWYIPLFLSPLIIYFIQNDPVKENMNTANSKK